MSMHLGRIAAKDTNTMVLCPALSLLPGPRQVRGPGRRDPSPVHEPRPGHRLGYLPGRHHPRHRSHLGANIGAIDQESFTSVGALSELATPWYSDQILPFDITLAASNEYGAMAGAKILGVEILNEGTGVSIDDTVTETQATFVAMRSISCRPGLSIRFR